LKQGESVCRNCDAIERGFLAHNHRIRDLRWTADYHKSAA
jgi:hypothetical protein